jgi:cobalt/nickel transport system permease protein
MVHISDGILTPEVWVTGFIITLAVLVFTLSKVKIEEIPKLSLVTSALFVASLVHIPIGPTSTHLILAGLAGIILGYGAYPAIFIAVLLQALLFQHGGITTIGINTLNIGLPALITAGIFWLGANKTQATRKYLVFGSMSGGLAIVLAVVFTSITLILTGVELFNLVLILIIAHIPVIVIETLMVGSVAEFLSRIKPEMLAWIKIDKIRYQPDIKVVKA